EDLVFREAKPVMGGRANWNGTSGDAGAQVSESGGINNFQGPNIITHYWKGAVPGKAPVNTRWAAPPANATGQTAPTRPKGVAPAARGRVALSASVRSPVPLLGIPGQPPPRRKAK